MSMPSRGAPQLGNLWRNASPLIRKDLSNSPFWGLCVSSTPTRRLRRHLICRPWRRLGTTTAHQLGIRVLDFTPYLSLSESTSVRTLCCASPAIALQSANGLSGWPWSAEPAFSIGWFVPHRFRYCRYPQITETGVTQFRMPPSSPGTHHDHVHPSPPSLHRWNGECAIPVEPVLLPRLHMRALLSALDPCSVHSEGPFDFSDVGETEVLR